MGCTGSKGDDYAVSTRNDTAKLERKLRQDYLEEMSCIKILLLGAGGCGKSTLLKQFKIINTKEGESPFSESELKDFKRIIRGNTLHSLKRVLMYMEEINIEYEKPANEAVGLDVLLFLDQQMENEEVSFEFDMDAVAALLKDKGFKHSLELGTKQSRYQILESAPYMLENIARIFSKKYVPTEADIVRSRRRTTGVVETAFEIEDNKYKIYDVGGQRGERKKWIYCFDDVTAIMFVTSLNEFNQVLAEEKDRNRMEESIELFAGIINMPYFSDAAVILFLNKKDLFREKIKTVNPSEYLPDFDDVEPTFKNTVKHIQEMFLECSGNQNRQIITHVTNATDRENVEFVFKACRAIILERIMGEQGMA